MRDSYVTMPDGNQSKLNRVVRKSDFDTMVATVESTMGIEIDACAANRKLYKAFLEGN